MTLIGCGYDYDWNNLENDRTLRVLWQEPPIVAYQRNTNLWDTLVKAKLNLMPFVKAKLNTIINCQQMSEVDLNIDRIILLNK